MARALSRSTPFLNVARSSDAGGLTRIGDLLRDGALGAIPSAKSASAGFVQIQNLFLRDLTLSPDARWLGAVLATWANSERLAWPGIRTVRRVTGLGLNRLMVARAELVKSGHLLLIRGRAGKGHFAAVHYEIGSGILYRRRRSEGEALKMRLPTACMTVMHTDEGR